MSALSAGVVQGVLLPEGTLWSPWAQVLATFVAINTVMYVAVAVAKILPKVHLGDWLSQSYARAESRSIHPRRPDGWPAPEEQSIGRAPAPELHRDPRLRGPA